ncbi:MAG TPA: S8 family serine peptidase [Terriglobales bacterium]|nr:S8 family serine peptidase [Terriglobales bacterium]
MQANSNRRQLGKARISLCIALIYSLLAVHLQLAGAITPPVPNSHAQLLGVLSSSNRFIVRDNLGLQGLNLACLLVGCNLLHAIGDAQGQLFVIQNIGLLNDPVAFLARLLSITGVIDAEIDQTVSTLGATVGAIPSYLTDEKLVQYYGAQVWEGYVVQTPNQIVRTEKTLSRFNVTGKGVTVALIDTGVDPTNNVLKSHLVYGYDFTRNASGGSEMGDITQSTAGVIDGSAQPAQLNQSTAGVIDQGHAQVINQPQYSAFGHGTMTAGIVHLVAPNASLMPLKAFNANGIGYASDVLRAIYYAVNHKAKVISMSFEFTGPSLELATAITYATAKSVICVASAGNDASVAIVYPSGLPNVIDVASTSNTNTPSSFSNYGTPPVWISAPGEAVMTTYPFGTYAVGWGTSFSAPFVSGTVALMASVNLRSSYLLTQTTAAAALSHAQRIPESQYGFGVLDTYRAVQAWKRSLPNSFEF